MLLPGVTGLGDLGSRGAIPRGGVWHRVGAPLREPPEPTPCAPPDLPRAASFVKSFGTCCKSLGAADVPQ